jgi:hypothetical protein
VVIKGRARGGAAALAAHLERRDTNERVLVSEMRGVTARDVRGALREMDAMGIGAESVRTLYHASINTAPGERLTDEQKKRAADRLEKELGFDGQPRIIVEHLKKDREHMHVVFLRIDTGHMVAIPDSHNYRRHELVARELEREFGHDRVQGAHVERDGLDRPERTPSHAEMQQAERTGLTPQEAKARVTELWSQADTGRAFAASVEAEGWVLARGDKRDFVIVDAGGGTHSLSRRIEGAKAADVRQRMADVDQATLPGVDEARTLQKGRGRVQEPEGPQPVPVVLRVSAPEAAAIAAEPLAIRPAAVAPMPEAIVPVSAPVAPIESERPMDEAEKRPTAVMFRQLYSAAAEVTQRIVGRARGMLDRKPRREPEPVAAPVVKPEQQSPSPAPKPEPSRLPAARQSRRQRMSAAEITEILERQRAPGHDRKGPDR